MTAGQAKVPERRSVRAQLVGNQQFRREALFLKPACVLAETATRELAAPSVKQRLAAIKNY
jgi:hypothetical protein